MHPLPPPSVIGPMSADDFAVALGLKERSQKDYPMATPRHEAERRYIVISYLSHNLQVDQVQQDIVWARFCALYLPATVRLFLDPPVSEREDPIMAPDFHLNNAYLAVLNGLQMSPYLSKYLRSTKPVAADGKRLAQVVAERLVTYAPTWDHGALHPPPNWPDDYFKGLIEGAVQVLTTILASFSKEKDQTLIISSATRDGLSHWLLIWSKRYKNDSLGSMVTGIMVIISGMKHRNITSMRKHLKNWDSCALPGCKATEKLRACGDAKQYDIVARSTSVRTGALHMPHTSRCVFRQSIRMDGTCTSTSHLD
ncbi:hypothetical protein Hypma_010747 [Hypsizygus marmoreus]|uniref:Uncharacterized protein n=1 Tax=Hypsizygus marmoreus TaxID=39966 RepID=A0A369JSA0_HYPMA|nr:hypothetical protein Hypma_010747 [Hypsizygus marmoreus]